MNNIQSRPTLSRRGILKLLGATGVTAVAAAGGYILFEYAPWLDYDEQANETWMPSEEDSAMSAPMRELIRFATLAANGHNAQAWKFAIKNNAIEIHPDLTRRLPVVDPDDRALWISLGCALENLLNREYTLSEKVGMWRGKIFSGSRLWNTQLSTDLTTKVTRLEVPVYFFHGVYDYTVSYPLAKAYYERLDAPVKGFYTFKQSAHSPLFEEPGKMRDIVRADVLTGSKGLADPE